MKNRSTNFDRYFSQVYEKKMAKNIEIFIKKSLQRNIVRYLQDIDL